MTKLRVDMAELTLGEMADVAVLLGGSMADAMTGPEQPRAIAAIACVVKRRTEPGFSFEDALRLRMADLEVVNSEEDADDPKEPNGVEPRLSPALGT